MQSPRRAVNLQAGSGFWPGYDVFSFWSNTMNMIRLRNLTALAVCLAFACILTAAGDDKEGEGKGKGKKGTSITAQVTAVDVTKSTITLAVRDGSGNDDTENSPLVDKTFAVAKDAKISIDGKAAKLADVKANSRASISLTDDRKTVTGITVGKGKGGGEGGEKSQPKKEKGKG